MFGDSLLVAPVFNEEGEASFYLPEGKWTHLLSNEQVEGGTWRLEEHDYFSLPLYVRPNSIVAFGGVNSKPDYDYADGVNLHLFNLDEEKTANCIVRNISAEAELEVSVSREGNKLFVSTNTNVGKPWSLVVRGIKEVLEVTDGAVETTELGVKITPERGVNRFTIIL